MCHAINTRMNLNLRFSFLALSVGLLLSTSCTQVQDKSVLDRKSHNGLAYDLVGEGPLVLLIHGTNLDRRMWQEESILLRSNYRVLSVDLRGQGASDFPDSSYSNHSDLIDLLGELAVDEAFIIGLSAGAQAALDMAVASPNLVRAMILVSPSLSGFTPKELPPFLDDLMVALRSTDFDRANEVLLSSSIMSVPDRYEELVTEMVTQNSRLWTIPFSLVDQSAPPAIELLDTINTPALVLVGQEDIPGIREQADFLTKRLPNVVQVSIENGGHLLNLTSSEAFHAAVADFLAANQE